MKELGFSKMSPFNHAQPALFPPTLCSLISVLGFSKQMQIDVMICISRLRLSLISSDILVKDFFSLLGWQCFPTVKIYNWNIYAQSPIHISLSNIMVLGYYTFCS